MAKKFKTTLNAALLGMDTDVVCAAGVPARLGTFTIPAGQAYSVGYGPFVGRSDAIGHAMLVLMDDTAVTPEAEEGLVSLEVRDPQGRHKATIFEARTEELKLGAADPGLRMPLAEDAGMINEDDRIELWFTSDAADTVDVSACSAAIDCTIYPTR
ncbi:MAG: hypothetical protein JJE29_00425 [Peptostreptococcaceae bacterium]|nr:hypothetical protein [Peptostreptococcaceae bacterium]